MNEEPIVQDATASRPCAGPGWRRRRGCIASASRSRVPDPREAARPAGAQKTTGSGGTGHWPVAILVPGRGIHCRVRAILAGGALAVPRCAGTEPLEVRARTAAPCADFGRPRSARPRSDPGRPFRAALAVAPQLGFEPRTHRLTAGCSTVELLRNLVGKPGLPAIPAPEPPLIRHSFGTASLAA